MVPCLESEFKLENRENIRQKCQKLKTREKNWTKSFSLRTKRAFIAEYFIWFASIHIQATLVLLYFMESEERGERYHSSWNEYLLCILYIGWPINYVTFFGVRQPHVIWHISATPPNPLNRHILSFFRHMVILISFSSFSS